MNNGVCEAAYHFGGLEKSVIGVEILVRFGVMLDYGYFVFIAW